MKIAAVTYQLKEKSGKTLLISKYFCVCYLPFIYLQISQVWSSIESELDNIILNYNVKFFFFLHNSTNLVKIAF